ncbi:chitin synthase [Malassezia yamatoensis]|uniref:Chitin synthase n=1 Tax=Malassezia yamatoensis TaxID=253288 RepID=A0AAJ5YUZ9_9BASI|nr:chitin synthase [Malassezia yamatoensis]
MPARPLFSTTRQTVPTPEVQYEPQFSEAYSDPLANPYDSWDQNAQPLPSYDESMSPTEAYRDEVEYRAGPSSQALIPQSTHLQPVPAPWTEGGRSPYLVPYNTPSKHSVGSTFSDQEDPNNALLGLLNDYDSSELHHPFTEVVHPDMSDPLSEETMRIHYGRIPQRQPRRSQTVRRIQLQKGHLVLECPVAPKLLEKLPIQEGREFTHMRYTAVTCDPDDFARDGYTLRSALFDPPRSTELCIVLTMYNEDERLFVRTMHGVMQNIAYLCKLKNSRVWGPDGWKHITVCLVADGRHQVSSRTLSVLATMGVYQEGVAKNSVRGQPVEAHLYEYTAQISVDHSMRLRSKERGIVPVQIVLCIKEHNRKKINSHRWCFNAFGPILEPNIYILLDVGTRPRARSISRLWNAFERDRHVGGACGEIVALKGKLWHGLVNPLVAAQNFEYKMSNILDKPMESAFGYINVLPGAFSAYRYEALKNDEMGNGPLCSYFKGEKLHGGSGNTDVFTSNMYLAEDRILCWELVTKRDSAWVLRFVKLAQAETDVPSTVPEFIAQRRRWLNGSFFAAIHSIIKFGYLYRSSHSIQRKFFFHLEMLYQTVQLLYSWFSLANYFIAFCILTDAVIDSHHWAKVPVIVCQYIYVIFLLFCYLLSMGNRPAGNRIGYLLSMNVFALLMVILMACTAYLMYASVSHAISSNHGASLSKDPQFVRVFIAVLSTYGVWLIASLLFFDPWHLVTSIIQYMLLTPSMVNIINIYAFCNTHDVSWGTKGSDKVDDLGSAPSTGLSDAVDVTMPTEAQDRDAAYDDACHVLASRPVRKVVQRDSDTYQKDYYAMVRTNVVLVFTLTNGALAVAIVNLPRSVHGVYMGFLFYSVAALAMIRLLGAIVYLCSALRRR